VHFVFGGAFNGKRQWVDEYYAMEQTETLSFQHLSRSLAFHKKVYIIEGFTLWVRERIKTLSINETRCLASQIIEKIKKEEKDKGAHFVLIGTEVGKGIVPMEPLDRHFRDVCGYIYQDMIKAASTVDYIWYGIQERLKGE
jgi:adenosylcobinamide kinase / adenosylcobinamide-phosphate guanylyltransferase